MENIQNGSSNRALLKCLQQSLFLYQGPSRNIHEVGALLHHRQFSFSQYALICVSKGKRHHDKIGPAQEFLNFRRWILLVYIGQPFFLFV